MSRILHVLKGERLKVLNEQLIVVKDEVNYKVDLDYIECVIIESLQCSITVSAHLLCAKYKIVLIICNQKHQPEVFCHNVYSYHKLTEKIKDQITWIDNPKVESVYKEILKSKLTHQANLLKEMGHMDGSDKIKDYVLELDSCHEKNKIENYESISARIYFKTLFGSSFIRREDDVINISLNYGYMIMRAIIMNVIVGKGYHPSIGVWHHSQLNNYNLADDLLEIYRPIVDYVVVNSVDDRMDFNKNIRGKILQVILQKVMYEKSVVSIQRSVECLLDGIMNYINGECESVLLPRVEVELYEY